MHRDIKPDNLLIAKPLDGPHQLTTDLIKVSDFGISVPFTPGLVSATGPAVPPCKLLSVLCLLATRAATTLVVGVGSLWAGWLLHTQH
jgi:serine/threonine protein kinase